MPTYSDEILRLAEITPVALVEGKPFSELANRLCGDKIQLAVDIDAGILQPLHWHAEGCAILRASAAYLARTLRQRSVTEAHNLMQEFFKSFEEENRFTAGPLAPVYKLPARYKCALLPWQACENFLREHKT